jgi:S-disulfanyl-L-cysteine oxidoreductase SoxD
MRPFSLTAALAAVPLLAVSFGVGVASASDETGPEAIGVGSRRAPSHQRAPVRAAWRSVMSFDSTGVYTVAQAERGLEVFNKVCSECHEVEDLTNEDFRFEWNGKTVYDLYDLVRTTMPDENPGTLTREQYLDAIAFVLKINNQPAGPNEFVGDSASASAVVLRLSDDAEADAAKPDTTVKPDTMAVPDTTVVPDTMTVPDTAAVRRR